MKSNDNISKNNLNQRQTMKMKFGKFSKMKFSMRSVLALGLLTISTISFTSVFQTQGPADGTNQSYVIFDSGEVATIRSYYPADDQVKLINAEQVFMLSNNISHAGANYLIKKNGDLYTVDTHGYMYHKEFYSINSSIKHYGGNYFITKKGQIHIIKNDGMILNYPSIPNHDIRKLSVVGGNYFITSRGALFVITQNGYYFDKSDMLTIKSSEVKIKGNNYLITKDGTVMTFGSEAMVQLDGSGNIINDASGNSKPLLDSNGNKQFFAVVYKYDQMKVKNIVKAGGNFFFDNEKNIHTVSNNGILDRGILNRKLKINLSEDVDRSTELPTKIGNNYFVYADGGIYTIDKDGYYYFLKKLERRISRTNNSNKLNKED